MVIIRQETAGEADAVSAVNRAAFAGDAEAKLVERLREGGGLSLSLVAEKDGAVVGHIAFSPVTIHDGARSTAALGLGPMAVLPSHQRTGIGARLIADAMSRLASQGHGIVVVVGHPEYYPRFGFLPAADFGLRWEHDVPAEVFMVRELRKDALHGLTGVVRYLPEFGDV